MRSYGRLLLLVMFVCGCQKQPERGAMPAFVDEYFDALFEWNPSTATSIGFHQYDSNLEDLSQPAIQRRIDRLKQLQARLDDARKTRRASDVQIDAEIL